MLGCFLLAAATGVLRFGFPVGLPCGLQMGDVRHAHSHLMFFGWVTPVLMLLLLRFQGPVSRAGHAVLLLTHAFAVASFVPFLISGYRLMTVFGRELPLSMITAGLNGVAWLAFIVLYLIRARYRKQTLAASSFLAALLMLLPSSLSAAALGGAGMMKAGPVVVTALATFFLDLFANGWFGLALLGVAYTLLPVPERHRTGSLGLAFLVAGLTVRNFAHLLITIGATSLAPVALAGSALAGRGLPAALLPLAQQLRHERMSLWHLALGFLALKGIFGLLLANPVFALWSAGAALRVFYLHAFLLGTISLGLVADVRAY